MQFRWDPAIVAAVRDALLDARSAARGEQAVQLDAALDDMHRRLAGPPSVRRSRPLRLQHTNSRYSTCYWTEDHRFFIEHRSGGRWTVSAYATASDRIKSLLIRHGMTADTEFATLAAATRALAAALDADAAELPADLAPVTLVREARSCWKTPDGQFMIVPNTVRAGWQVAGAGRAKSQADLWLMGWDLRRMIFATRAAAARGLAEAIWRSEQGARPRLPAAR
jgi:hypothetical protein